MLKTVNEELYGRKKENGVQLPTLPFLQAFDQQVKPRSQRIKIIFFSEKVSQDRE